MILAIRALRATIFAFNASIWVSRPALASVTDDAAVIADAAALPDVASAEKANAIITSDSEISQDAIGRAVQAAGYSLLS